MAPVFSWVQPLVVAVGVIISLIVALITIRINRRIARIKATLDLIESSETTEIIGNTDRKTILGDAL